MSRPGGTDSSIQATQVMSARETAKPATKRHHPNTGRESMNGGGTTTTDIATREQRNLAAFDEV